MRADMFKVIVERPRWGAGHARAAKLKRTRDLKHIGLKKHAWTDADYTKGLSDHLAPLARFLHSRRGRRWDDVFSEICARLDTGSTVKMHVREHLQDLVLLRISRGRYGELIHNGRPLLPEHLEWGRRHLFVDPEDGILKGLAVLKARLAKAKGGAAR